MKRERGVRNQGKYTAFKFNLLIDEGSKSFISAKKVIGICKTIMQVKSSRIQHKKNKKSL